MCEPLALPALALPAVAGQTATAVAAAGVLPPLPPPAPARLPLLLLPAALPSRLSRLTLRLMVAASRWAPSGVWTQDTTGACTRGLSAGLVVLVHRHKQACNVAVHRTSGAEQRHARACPLCWLGYHSPARDMSGNQRRQSPQPQTLRGGSTGQSRNVSQMVGTRCSALRHA